MPWGCTSPGGCDIYDILYYSNFTSAYHVLFVIARQTWHLHLCYCSYVPHTVSFCLQRFQKLTPQSAQAEQEKQLNIGLPADTCVNLAHGGTLVMLPALLLFYPYAIRGLIRDDIGARMR